ncbi:MAG: hypothetical protein JNK23_14860 [Opitutaceae bacterium]|nr:hypothetical protein [Opitutaceae bacterium]
MKRVYLIIPAALMLAFVVYFRWWGPRTTKVQFAGESPQWWKRNAVAILPPITTTNGDEYEGRDGAHEASLDLRAGKVVLLGYGLPYPWNSELKEIWKREFDVESRDLAGCLVTEALVEYVSSYNRIMHAHIIERFGSGTPEAVYRKARTLYDERHNRKG